MTLIDALQLLKQPIADDAPILGVALACGFTPLHLETFLHAWLRRTYPDRRVSIRTGLFGDLQGNLERLLDSENDAVAVVIEWQDIDSRLGIRNLGGWQSADLADIVKSAERRIASFENILRSLSHRVPCVCSLPAQPLPPMFPQRTYQSGPVELRLRELVASLAVSIAQRPGVRVVSAQGLDEISPLCDRTDIRAEIMSGFPYKLPHASVLAKTFADIMRNSGPKKGLITDLDDTLWAGILGEIGVDKISWSLDSKAIGHGLYQQFLGSLASSGVLIAVASKNSASLVKDAFERKDLLLSKDQIFPFEVHWSRKSESVQRILKTWNISAADAVFIDDSPMEAAEVKTAVPEIECRTFPKGDVPALWNLMKELRNLFGKSLLSEEDSFRLESIRTSTVLKESWVKPGESQHDFLKDAGAFIQLGFERSWDTRTYELINKTNQFNLNGRRIGESELLKYLSEDDSFLLTAQYEDKYGRLGKVAAILGKRQDHRLLIDSWVMSCRAFSRRIEHQCLKYLFDKLEVEAITLDYHANERNGPLREFLEQMAGSDASEPIELSKTAFLARVPALYHRVDDTVSEWSTCTS